MKAHECVSCRERGWTCDLNGSSIDAIGCPGEECASCDYRYGDLESTDSEAGL